MIDFDFAVPHLTEEERRGLQAALIDEGYSPGEADGVYDDEFSAALRSCLSGAGCQ